MMKIFESNRPARGLALAALLLLVLPAPGDAQQRRPRMDRSQMEQELRQRFQAMVWRELGLDDTRGEALSAAVQEFQEPRRELAVRQRRLARRLTSTGALLSDDEARAVLDELVAVKRAEVQLMEEEQARLLELLEPPQLVRFYTLREQFGRRIRQLREGGPGGGGPPGDLLLW